MPFTARDLRHRVEYSYPLLYAYLHRHAQRFLGPLKYDAFEVDTVIGHVEEQLVRLGLLGGENRTPLTALDRLTDAQFYAFLSRSVRNKAIDRLRKRHFPLNTLAELEENIGDEENPLDDAVTSIWGTTPFATPEQMVLQLTSKRELRLILKHCILVLETAPHQLQAVIRELRDVGADELLQEVIAAIDPSLSTLDEPGAHLSQHKDHAHKKIRHCLQQHSTNLAVKIALRLTEYGKHSTSAQVNIRALLQEDLSEDDVRRGLRALVADSLLSWGGEDVVYVTADQMKRLARFYKEE